MHGFNPLPGLLPLNSVLIRSKAKAISGAVKPSSVVGFVWIRSQRLSGSIDAESREYFQQYNAAKSRVEGISNSVAGIVVSDLSFDVLKTLYVRGYFVFIALPSATARRLGIHRAG
jgi:hypothetical protein